MQLQQELDEEEREFRADQPVLLLQGRLQRYEEVDNSKEVRTELVKETQNNNFPTLGLVW